MATRYSSRYLILLILCCGGGLASSAITVYVNSSAGNDTQDCGTTRASPCETLEYALSLVQEFDSLSISLASGTYYLPPVNDSLTTFTDKLHVAIKCDDSSLEGATIQCDSTDNKLGSGLSFYQSSNIELRNIKLLGCGALHNSTSTNDSSSTIMEYLTFKASIYFLFCCNVTIERVVVSDSIGTGVVFYSTVGKNVISSSNFTDNREFNAPGGGGVAVEFIYCIPGDPDCSETQSSDINATYSNGSYTGASYTFKSCIFAGNIGQTSDLDGDSFIEPRANRNIALGRGAGLSILYKKNVTGIPISVIDCTFEDNTAVWGGAMLIEFQDHSTDNDVSVVGTVVNNNKCHFNACTYQGTGGGGVRIQFASFYDTVRDNTVRFLNTTFSDNIAYFGGGVSFFTFPSSHSSYANKLVFVNCTWASNTARLGSAIDFSLWNQNDSNITIIGRPTLSGCTFDLNRVHYTNLTGTPAGVGTIYTDTVPILFAGETTFSNNDGSAIVGLDAAVEFNFSSSTSIEGNKARVGGGIALFNKAFLKLDKHCTLTFTENSAYLHGGAIYWEGIGDHQLISSRNCFIRYYDNTVNPSSWETRLTFRDNKAGLTGDAIFATTIIGCLWGGKAYDKLLPPEKEYDSVFCWNDTTWDYGSDNCTNSSIISTSPGYYANENMEELCGEGYSFSFVPGKPTSLDITMLDDRRHPISKDSVVFSLYWNESEMTKYTTHENQTYNDCPGHVTELRVGTIQPRVISTTVDLTFSDCPPGFLFHNETSSCDTSYFSFVRIHSDFTADIQFGYWMGPFNDSNKLYIGQCFFCPWNDMNRTNQTNYLRLPNTSDELNELFCAGLNRNGTLCSSCFEGYCSAVNSAQYKCINISDNFQGDTNYARYAWLVYIIFEYVPVTVMLIIVFLFNVSVTSGPANAFIFFAQLISTTFSVDADGQIDYSSITSASLRIKKAYKFLYGIWNLNFFTNLDIDGWFFCLGSNIGPVQIMALKFIAAFYPLVVIGLIICLVHLYNRNCRCIVCILRPLHWLSARCLRRLNIQRSLMDSLATFLILSYVKFAVTACYLLYPNPLQDASGKYELYVSYYDGSIKYASREYSPYLLISCLVVLWCFLLPVLLLLYSIRPCYICLERLKLEWLQPGEKLCHFLNAFHRCFKDGTDGGRDCRYFAAVYFFLKLLLISAYAFGLDWMRQYIYQQILCTLCILLVGTLQPYRKMRYNFLDMGMFSLLAIINAISLYSKHLQSVGRTLSKASFAIQVILIFIPLFYFIGYSAFFIIRGVVRAYCRQTKLREPMEDSEFDFNRFMNDVETEDRLQANNYYGAVNESGDQVVREQPGRRQWRRNPQGRKRATEPIMSRIRDK